MPDSLERGGIAGLGELVLQVDTRERRECPSERAWTPGVSTGATRATLSSARPSDPHLPLTSENARSNANTASWRAASVRESRARPLTAAGATSS